MELNEMTEACTVFKGIRGDMNFSLFSACK
jgi:hypothetical protein